MALNKDGIAEAGLKLLNQVGLDDLTLQLIARELNVKAPSLYWYINSKHELLDEMATQMLREAAGNLPAPTADWEEWLSTIAWTIRRTLLRYRDGARVYAGTCFTDPSLPDQRMFQPLLDAGFDPQRIARAWFTLFAFIIGFTIEEQGIFPEPGHLDMRYAQTGAREALVSEAFRAVIAEWVPANDMDARFADGLAIVLGGTRSYLTPTAGI